MLAPLGLDTDYTRTPYATLSLIVLMAVGTAAYQMLPLETVRTLVLDAEAFRPSQCLTSMVLHGSVLHFLFNALYLWVFGRYVEDRLGWWRFLLLFLAFEVVGDIAWVVLTTKGTAIGSSGAVAGCMGLVFFTAPKSEVVTYWHLIVSMAVRRFPVWFLLGLWLASELFFTWFDTATDLVAGSAHAAHLGGFLAGCVSSWVLRSPLAKGTGWYLPRAPEGGQRPSPAYGELLQSEVMWRTLEETMKDRGGGSDDSASPGPSKPDPRPPSKGIWG